MTTAHRPTWKAAVGRAEEGGWNAGGALSTSISALDAPAHLTLKRRRDAVDKKAALKQSLLALEQAESSLSAIKMRKPVDPEIEEQSKLRLLKQTAEVDHDTIKKYDDADVDLAASDEESNLDSDGDDEDANESEDDDDEDDDEAALQAELAKIRSEREHAKQRSDEEKAVVEAGKLEAAALLGNPLLNGEAAAGRMKRRWNDDVVFRNQAKGEPLPKKRFINDTVRNDFHRRFLNKFIR